MYILSPYVAINDLNARTFLNQSFIMALELPPPAKSPLNRYRILSPNASVRVSPLCFGSMSLGTKWDAFMGSVTKEDAFKLLDYFYDQGGNFIDVHSGGFCRC